MQCPSHELLNADITEPQVLGKMLSFSQAEDLERGEKCCYFASSDLYWLICTFYSCLNQYFKFYARSVYTLWHHWPYGFV